MALPREIRNLIYKLVFSELVHMQYNYNLLGTKSAQPEAGHRSCKALLSEQQNFHDFMSSKTLSETCRGQSF